MNYNYMHFTNDRCEFFPCHTVKDREKFNCLFCYCPLYPLKDRCGGNFVYTEDGTKDCSKCLIPHSEKAYEYIMSKINEVIELAKNK